MRYSDNGALTVSHGRAYDADNNSTDFWDNTTMTIPPNNSLTTPQAPTTGTPSVNTHVTANDPLSNTAQCDATGHWIMPGIATGTWTLSFGSGNYFDELTNVPITALTTINVPNGTTAPAWPVASLNNMLIQDTTAATFIRCRHGRQ